MNKRFLLFLFAFITVAHLQAAPPEGSPFIKIDQFGYLCNSAKVAVISNPQEGYNADESFTAGQQYQVRRWDDDSVVYSGSIEVWNDGATHAQSGDKGWWFDFSEVTESGSYYLYDAENEVASHRFEIGEDVYNNLLKQAVRTFYYQRSNYAKEAQYAGDWSDAVSFEGPDQDRAARDVNDKENPDTERDLHGGWFDAGDINKYTTFAFDPLMQMMEAYRMNPAVFKDDYNIPESGNGIPDLVDEIQYEMDWLMRMQDATATDGLFLKVGVIDFNDVSPPSADTRPKYYVGECTSATITGAAVFALGGLVFQSQPQLATYGDTLIARAERAWERAAVTTENYTVFEAECDSQEVKAGDADRDELEQREYLVAAAVYLYEATGKTMYRDYVESNYTTIRPIVEGFWGPYRLGIPHALLKYTTLPDVSPEVSQAIVNQKAGQTGTFSVDNYRAKTDLYRGFMEDWAHHWGSNFIRANSGNINLDFETFGINSDEAALYRETAEQYLHWLNGVNPMGLVMLSNMYDHGAEHSVNEIYHTWFYNGTKYDNALTSEVGPAPGYLSGGPNKSYPIAAVSPPFGQPHQKSYRDWNTQWNGSFGEESFRITEPAIYYQGSYIALLSRLMPAEQQCLANVAYGEPKCEATGTIQYERWGNLEGDDIDDLTSDTRFPGQPDQVQNITYLRTPFSRSNDHGGRIHGTVCAPQTGYYTFWVLGDGNVRLSLSSDDDPDNKQEILRDGYRWIQRSRPVQMEAGKSYYLEVLTSGSRLTSIGWQLPNHRLEAVISSDILSPAADTTAMAPAAPVNLVATAFSASQVNVSWSDASDNEEGFVIERRIKGDSTWGVRDTLYVDASGYPDADVLPDTTYFYRMRSFNAVDASDYSNEDTVRTLSIPVADGPLIIYQDDLAEDWQNWSWQTVVDFGQTTVVNEGNNAMQVMYEGPGVSGLSLRKGETINAKGYEAIQMDIHGGDGPDQDLDVLIQTSDFDGISELKRVTTRSGEWQEVTVLLSNLGDPSVIKRVTVQSASDEVPTSFYIDNLRLVPAAVDETEATGNSRLTVYPNVLKSGPLHLKWEGTSPTSREVVVYNIQGQSVFQAVQQERQLQIDRARFRYPGVYVVRVRENGQTQHVKILVQ